MKILQINCQSWKTAKYSIGNIVDNCDIDLLCLSETFESEKEPVKFRNWSKLSKPRKDGYGGVAILYKDSEDGLIVERKQELEEESVEMICVKVTVDPQRTFLLVAAYIPPDKKEQMVGFVKVLQKCKRYKHLVVAGDLNAKSMNWNNSKSNVCGTVLE